MLAFAFAVLFLIITPGPGVLSTAGVGAAFGRKAGLYYVAGLWAGTNIVSIIIVTGLAAFLFSGDILRLLLGIFSSLYLLSLAVRIALAESKIAFIEALNAPGFKAGLLLQFINPKAYAVNSALFSSFSFIGYNFTTELLLKFLIMNLVWIPLHILWLEAGIKLHSLSLSARITQRVNYGMAASLSLVVMLSFYSLWREGL